MSDCWHHAVSSTKKWGGEPEEYYPLHMWFDESKHMIADFRHRSLRHHAEGIAMFITIKGPTLKLTTGKVIPMRWIGERHVLEDLGKIPSFVDWCRAVRPEPWMGRTPRLEEALKLNL